MPEENQQARPHNGHCKKTTINGANPSFAVRNPGPPKHRRGWQKMVEQWWNVTAGCHRDLWWPLHENTGWLFIFFSIRAAIRKQISTVTRKSMLDCPTHPMGPPQCMAAALVLSLKNKYFSWKEKINWHCRCINAATATKPEMNDGWKKPPSHFRCCWKMLDN